MSETPMKGTPMADDAKVGDTVRPSIEGVVYRNDSERLFVDGRYVNAPDRTVEVLSRATPPLPNEPGTWWLDKDNDVWRVEPHGDLRCPTAPEARPQGFAPFRQLVLK